MKLSSLTTPHGGTLKELLGFNNDKKNDAYKLPGVTLNQRQLCDLELLMNGGFSPLEGFMNQQDYEKVVSEMRLINGLLWPIPIVLDITEEAVKLAQEHKKLGLYDPEGFLLAVLNVESIWKPDKKHEAELVYNTTSTEHPGVAYLYNETHDWYVGGKVERFDHPIHYDFRDLRLSPSQLREQFEKRGWTDIAAFQTRNPMHRAHQEITLRSMKQTGAKLLIHPVVGLTKRGDIDGYTRVKCYKKIIKTYPEGSAALSLLPLAMRMAGPREALWHAIIRKNYGCNYFIIGRDHAGPGNDSSGQPFYGPYEAQELAEQHQDELGMKVVKSKEMVYVPSKKSYFPVDEVKDQQEVSSISGTQLRNMLQEGKEIPEWFSYPEVVSELQRVFLPRKERGFTLFFTGFSGSGKSTVANILYAYFKEINGRPATLLDGDIVRKYLSSELGFSKEHRDLNIKRVGFVASEITKNKGIAICALIAPYSNVRNHVRELVSQYGDFIEIYVSTSIDICEQRDRKGLYAKARAGVIKGFTGIDDPYEAPENPEIAIDTTDITPEESAQKIISFLVDNGYIEKYAK